jgi:two-component system sensor histidine kinase KdpD
VLLSTADGELEVGAEVPAGVALSEAESAAAQWCAEHNVQTGLGTSTLPSVAWRFLPLRALDKTIGVLAARPQDVPSPTLAQSLATLAGQSAMAVERARVSTQTAKAQAKEDSQKLRDALLSSLSHDLRTPLTAIRGAAETLNQPGLDDTTRVDLQASIIQDTARMTRFLANITDMARAQAGATEARRERLRLETAVEEAVSRVSGALYTSVSIDPAASHVLADPGLLEQVLVNILENAVKYAPAGSRIVIRATRAGARVQLSVADEGVGIPPAELEAVFDSFFRASRGDRVAPGTGLGLAIAKSFTEAMGGRIWAQSPRPDLPADGLPGTVITLELPAA